MILQMICKNVKTEEQGSWYDLQKYVSKRQRCL